MAVLGFDEAEKLLHEGGDDLYEGYADHLAGLKQELGELPESAWQSDLYAMRLKVAAALCEKTVGVLPKAMQCSEWALKQLSAALGSWTELRHDTILYTKQSYTASQMALAGVGKGGRQPPPPPPPRGYVEPVPEVYRAIRLAVEALLNRIETLNYPEDKALTGNLRRFSEHLQTLEEISLKELRGEKLAEKDYQFIRNIGGAFRLPEYGFAHHRDVTERFRTVMDDAMPIVADVHTDTNTQMVLEEAVGLPWVLYMICPVDNDLTVCKGAVYSYYEFKQPMSERLTDEEWRKMLREDKAPDSPPWMSRYVVKMR